MKEVWYEKWHKQLLCQTHKHSVYEVHALQTATNEMNPWTQLVHGEGKIKQTSEKSSSISLI